MSVLGWPLEPGKGVGICRRRYVGEARGGRGTAANSGIPHNGSQLTSFKRMICGKKCGLHAWIQVVGFEI